MKINLRTKLALTVALAGATVGGIMNARADYSSTVLSLGPVAYYRLDTTNQIPNEMPATNRGSLGSSSDGQYQTMALTRGINGAIAGDTDTSVNIDGTKGQQVVVPYSPLYNPNGPFTVEFWAKPAVGSTASGNHTAAISMVNGQNTANADDRSGWAVRHNAADWQFVIGFDHSDGSTFYSTTLAASASAQEDVWQHVVAVYTPNLVSLYVNGTLQASQAPNSPLMPNTFAPLILGDRGYTGWDFIGDLDEFAIYTNELSAVEIKQHYDNGTNSARLTPYASLVLQKSPAVYFRLDEPSLKLPVATNNGSYGQNYNGMYQVGTTPGLPGPQSPAVSGFETTNNAAGFNGVSGSVTIPGLPLNADTVTMVCWIKRNGVQPARAAIMHNRKVSAPEVKATGLGFQDDGLALSYNWEDQGNAYNFNPGFVPPDQTWTFFAVSVAPDSQVMYMGTAAGLVARTNTYGISPHDFSGTTLELGWDNYASTRVYRGAIDEFAMFDKTLSYSQISSLFNAALPAILAVNRTPADPVYEGMSVTFQSAVAGPAPINYQWRKAGVALTGKTSASLVLNGVTTADSGDYDVQVTSGGKSLTSPVSSLQVLASPPILTQSPADAVRFINGRVSFACAVVGSQPQSFQWQHGGTAIPGATDSTLTVTDLQLSDAGNYTVVISNPLGTNQASANLTLVTPSKYAAAALGAAPIGYWRLDETGGTTAYDLWGGADGTLTTTGVTNNQPGPRPSAYSGFDATNTAYGFAGNASKVTIPPLNLNKASATIVAWINPHGTQVSYAGIVFSRGNKATGLDFNGTTGNLGYHWNDAAATYNWDSTLGPVADQWNFVALVVEPSQATMYLDNGTGLQSTVNTVAHEAASFADPLYIGVDSPGGGRGYVGLIDEVTVYDRALSSSEIAALRAAGFTGNYTPTPVSFAQQPRSQGVVVGSSVTLSAKVKGSVPLTYQWQKNGTDLPGATRASLTFPSAAQSDSGSYQLVVSQGATKVTSNPATLTVSPSPTYLNLTNGLVLHLKFDGDYADSSGRTNNGTPMGTPAFVAGKLGQAVTLTTASSSSIYNYVALGSRPDFSFTAKDSFSVSYWINFTSWLNDLPMIGNAVGSTYQLGWCFANEGGKIELSLVSTGNSGTYVADPVAGSPRISDGTWHNIVGVVDREASLASVYVDGGFAGSFSIDGLDTLDPATDLVIGQNPTGDYGVDGSGSFDDVGIWRRALTAYEAQGIYLVGSQYGRSFDTVAPPEVQLSIKLNGNNITVSWPNGTLESANSVTGTWETVSGANPPTYTTPIGTGAKFYRAKLN